MPNFHCERSYTIWRWKRCQTQDRHYLAWPAGVRTRCRRPTAKSHRSWFTVLVKSDEFLKDSQWQRLRHFEERQSRNLLYWHWPGAKRRERRRTGQSGFDLTTLGKASADLDLDTMSKGMSVRHFPTASVQGPEWSWLSGLCRTFMTCAMWLEWLSISSLLEY